MKAAILAAGQGTRMGPLTCNRPKVMLPVANMPLLSRVILSARDAGIREFVLVVGFGQENIRLYFGDGSSLNVSIEYAQQQEQLGTADAVRSAMGLVNDRFLMLNGDIIVSPLHIRNMVKQNRDVVMTARRVDNPSSCNQPSGGGHWDRRSFVVLLCDRSRVELNRVVHPMRSLWF